MPDHINKTQKILGEELSEKGEFGLYDNWHSKHRGCWVVTTCNSRGVTIWTINHREGEFRGIENEINYKLGDPNCIEKVRTAVSKRLDMVRKMLANE